MTMIGKDCPVRANAFCLSSEKRDSSAAMSPAETLCFDIFSPPPGDSDVISHDILDPGVDARLLARQPAGPKPVHQNPGAVRSRGRLVNPFDMNLLRSTLQGQAQPTRKLWEMRYL